MLKYSVKEYYFRAALCHLCIDVLDAERAIDRYVELYPAFNDSRECKLLKVPTSFSLIVGAPMRVIYYSNQSRISDSLRDIF